MEGQVSAVELVAMAEELQQAQTFLEKYGLTSSSMNFQWNELAAWLKSLLAFFPFI